ncbi:MAG: autotransporter outer membrane beta-barrel domain-containing protein [Fusobacteriaceae bacterium]
MSSSDLESDTFYIGAFAKKNIENFRLLGSLGYQKNKFDAKRVLDNGLDRFDFDKSFDTDGFSAMLETRYIVPINETLTVEPKLVLDYTNISQDSINEGTEPMGMEIDSHKIGTYGAEVGVDLVKTFVGDNGYSGKAFAGIAYGYTGGDTDERLEAKIGNGSKFDIDAVDMDKNTGKATIGVELNNGKGFNYGVGYTYEAGKDTKNSKVTLGFGYKF